MERKDLIRRVLLLCAHFARNRAYYLAGWNERELRIRNEFWITVNSNFMDIAVLEWCKLFADNSGAHCWCHVVREPTAFEPAMYAAIGISTEQFAETISEMRTYRDKFVAHLDELPEMRIPLLDTAWAAVCFYADQLIKAEGVEGLDGLPLDLTAYANATAHDAANEYDRRLA